MSRKTLTLFILISLFLLCLVCASGCETQKVSAVNEPPGTAAEPTAEPAMLTTPESSPVPDAARATPEPSTGDEPGTTASPESAAQPAPETAFVPETTPEPSAAPEVLPVPESESSYTGPDLTEGESVDDEFFADAAFIGNSLVDGLSRYGGLNHASFYAATSASVVNVDMTQNQLLETGDKGTLLDAMTEKDYEKIYILLGINEIGFEPDYFSQLYGSLLDRIRQAEPRADIYIMSLSPVTEKRSESSDIFNMERIGLYNDALYALAQEKECYYVDLCQALAAEDGYLAEDASTDGIHLKPEKYPDWAEYLRTHAKQ